MQSKLSKSEHHRQQMNYFEDEFAKLSKFHLEPWMGSYLRRIDTYLLRGESGTEKKLLDIATGSGYVAITAAENGFHAIACDLSQKAIDHLNKIKKIKKLKNLTLIKCYAEAIPLKDKSVDYIVANAILEHIPAEKKTIKEWKRLLKPGGRILITVPLKYRYVWPFLWPVNYFHDNRIGHLRRYDKQTLEEKFKMKTVSVFYTGHLLKVLDAIVSFFYKNELFAQFSENVDEIFIHKPYGASNISIIFEKK